MKVIPFDKKYRKEIESGEYHVYTKEGTPVTIDSWGENGGRICGFVHETIKRHGEEYPGYAVYYNDDGTTPCNKRFELILTCDEKENTGANTFTTEYGRGFADGQYMAKLGQPKIKFFIFKAIPRLLEMLPVSKRAISYCEMLAEQFEKEGYEVDAKLLRERIEIMKGNKLPKYVVMDENEEVVDDRNWNSDDGTSARVRIANYLNNIDSIEG